MTVIMSADTAIFNSSPMLGEYPGNPGWKMKESMTSQRGDNHRNHSITDYTSDSDALDQLLAPFVDIDVAEMANYLDLDTCELGLIDEGVSWPGDDDDDDLPDDFLTDTMLDIQQSFSEPNGHCSPTNSPCSERESTCSAVTEDHIYSLSCRVSTTSSGDMDSHAPSTSGYSSGSDSLISSEDAPPAPSLSPKPLLFTQSASLLHQQARSLLTPKVLAKVSEAAAAESPHIRKGSRKRVPSRNSLLCGRRKWSRMDEGEQQESILSLSSIISSQLGVRERLEAIKIINPNSAASPTDCQVVIDMKPINDSRFSKLQKFVRLHADDLSGATVSSSSDNSSSLPTQLSAAASENGALSSNPSICKGGRKRRGRGRHEGKAHNQQLSREQQQRAKEIQSGLFVHEMRVSVSHTASIEKDEDDDDDIDILE